MREEVSNHSSVVECVVLFPYFLSSDKADLNCKSEIFSLSGMSLVSAFSPKDVLQAAAYGGANNSLQISCESKQATFVLRAAENSDSWRAG